MGHHLVGVVLICSLFSHERNLKKKTEKKPSSDVDEVQVSEAPGYLEKISPQVAMQQEPIDWSYQSHI